MFTPLQTPRLVVRAVRADDVEELHARRNDPAVALLQDWEFPYPRARAEALVAAGLATDAPADGQWWPMTIQERETGEVVGDLVLHLTNGGRTGEVGYSLTRRHWGRGYATEALTALVGWVLDELPVTRLAGLLHPDNRASAMVLERTGFVFEGHTRLSFWHDDDNSDDWIYGLTRQDWTAWTSRPLHPPREVSLEPVTTSNKEAVLALRTHHTQEAFVAPMLHSFADALVPDLVAGAPLVPWLRAVRADGQLVGFAMLALSTAQHPEPYLWRLLVDRLHQRRGIGRRVVELVAAECRAAGARSLLVSWGEGRGSPRPFYEGRGFEPTGRVDHGETEARLTLS